MIDKHLFLMTFNWLDCFGFRCLRYMGDYTNCLMRGYGVVPSTPTNVRVINIDVNFALVHWDPPKNLKDTVTHYNVHYRQTDDIYKEVNNVSVPKFIHL